MLRKGRRYLEILKVFTKYNLFSLLYKEINRNYISSRRGTCYLDVENQQNASKMRLAFEELGPTFVKLGQIMSKRPDILPPSYIRELANLQDHVNPLEFEQMLPSFASLQCAIPDTQNGEPEISMEQVIGYFDEFDTKPIASASIAQVYKAKLNDEKVAVKVSRPGLINKINIDLSIIEDLKPFIVRIGGFGNNIDFDEFLYEFRELLNKELDFRNEARNIKRFRENFESIDDVNIPQVYDDYCTESVLVMEYMEGTPVKNIQDLDSEQRLKYTHMISSSYLKQVYLDGLYHADPHGGNILIQNNSIAYIDFGAIGIIDGELRRNMLNLFYGIYKKNLDIAFEAFLRIADIKKEDINVRHFKLDLDDLIAKQNYALGQRQNDSYANLALKYNLSLPSDFSTLERSLILIEGVCLELNPDFNLIDDARPLITEVLLQRYSPAKAMEYFQLEGDRYFDIFKNLPQGVDDVIETIRGYRIEKLENKTNEIKRNRMYENFASYVFLSIILVTSAYLATRADTATNELGIAGFVVAILLFGYSFLRNT
ncbi:MULTISPECIES: ABC1 kinase family protein [Methanohalophilus]|uniref:AarF/ABC1/UbiB kinase family protein n=1 Tax=Methanohalophilus euhalobius TaxID=51203 RepID=A0A314ZSI7_9EURY|nr:MULTISPECIES: lipopolysaccharide core heptose(II) kinase RfaY [Methanohalophilus]OBZ35565.1 MAG: protein kinase [Methanohalophilus sp. DAL1]PQV41943.1 ubiquinone biosynthesis protein [Methanohalophilus euhalobius]RNI12343.1 AarF/ABC1/UbiB kinase family protein [Methanohalophilus euhalobius]